MKRGPPKPPETPAPFHNPFRALQGLEVKPGANPAPPAAPAQPQAPARAVVRMERKGRGGKEVTVVEQLGLKEAALEEWLKSLKQSLGCGGTREGEALVLQGDHRDRVRSWLEARGVKRISVG